MLTEQPPVFISIVEGVAPPPPLDIMAPDHGPTPAVVVRPRAEPAHQHVQPLHHRGHLLASTMFDAEDDGEDHEEPAPEGPDERDDDGERYGEDDDDEDDDEDGDDGEGDDEDDDGSGGGRGLGDDEDEDVPGGLDAGGGRRRKKRGSPGGSSLSTSKKYKKKKRVDGLPGGEHSAEKGGKADLSRLNEMFTRYLTMYEQGTASSSTKFGGLTEFVFAILLELGAESHSVSLSEIYSHAKTIWHKLPDELIKRFESKDFKGNIRSTLYSCQIFVRPGETSELKKRWLLRGRPGAAKPKELMHL